ncbi:glycosyl hydrolase family 38 C-terminal domain protein [Streptococcus ictaluri 707-05]|uniref:Glycosyl hydrolase family 38 C-terminal domain protein n=1 Tax=Streptococcus ictaluri 707-05 TaxID=764299 RepID=G5K185_9STRE|nr:glycosyl hydrolase family 38 C-terminal domain protein [Streptococcus ictaluri 707-05]
MEAVIDITERRAGRSKELAKLTLTTLIRLEKGNPRLQFTTTFDNQMTNHRLRVLFPSPIEVDHHFADSIFETVKRPNKPNQQFWENPSNPQHQECFVSLFDGENGLTIGNYGLNEYEILPETATVALTLLRCVGELGDWGYFPTPEAQCLGQQEVHYSFESIRKETQYASYWRAQEGQVPPVITQTDHHKGQIASSKTYLAPLADQVALTAFKRRISDNALITRAYNLSNDKSCPLSLDLTHHQAQVTDLLEREMGDSLPHNLEKAEIITLAWKED